jgi:sugar phosphate isomerase/epimerase
MMSASFLSNPGTTVKDMFSFTRELGMKGIDFCTANNHPVPPGELRKMCDDFEIQAVCNTVVVDVNAPGMTKQKWLDKVKQVIEEAYILQTGKIMLPTPGTPGIDKEVTRKKWLEFLNEATEIGEKAGILVSIESYAANAAWSPFISSDDILLAVKNVPKLKVTFDNGNHSVVENPAEAFKKLAPHVIHAHFKDWEKLCTASPDSHLMPDGNYYRMTAIGNGIVDSKACIQTMKEYGYNGFIDVEYFGRNISSREAIKASCEYMNKIINQV